jgi:hypothetical protein
LMLFGATTLDDCTLPAPVPPRRAPEFLSALSYVPATALELATPLPLLVLALFRFLLNS